MEKKKMGVEILPQHWSAILCIIIMIGTLVFAYFKKWLMTYGLIISNFIVFVFTLIYPNQLIYGITAGSPYAGLGFRPIYLYPEGVAQIYTLFTSMFIHGDFFHILANMFIFFFIGMAFEQRIGGKRFIIIYLITGVIGSLTHSLLVILTYSNPTDLFIPLIGASGAIFGIMGAFASAYPNDEVLMPIPVGFFMIFRKIKVLYAVLIFAVIETIVVLIGSQDNTAHFAHFGGLVGGVIISMIFIRRSKEERMTDSSSSMQIPMYMQQKIKHYDYNKLDNLATTPELKTILDKIRNETVPQVQDIWLEHFFEKTKCPKCGSSLHHFNRKVNCEKCDFQISI
jgi:membrane associated rhomboid family serine protease